MNYQEELARLQLEDRKKKEKEKKKADKEMEGCLGNCGCFLFVLSVILIIVYIFTK